MDEFKNHTFVICAYKESKYLEECIQSIINQRVKSNIIISTSTPNDYIKEMASKYSIPLVINNGKNGISEDWNFGVSNIKTDYVTVVHQDDIYCENYLEEIVKNIEKGKNFVIAFSGYQELKNGKIIPLTINLKIKKILLFPLRINGNWKINKRFAIAFGCSICCPAVTLNTKVVGKRPYNTKMKCDCDWNTWYEISKYRGRFLYINKPLMQHRIHEESETSNAIESHIRLEEDLLMLKKFWPDWFAKFLMKKYEKAIVTNDMK